MRSRPVWIGPLIGVALLAACGADVSADSTTSSLATTTTAPTTSTTRVEATTTTSVPATTTIPPTTTTTTGASGPPGEPSNFGPGAGETLAVIGVAHDDVLNLRAAPGADQTILDGIPPLYDGLIALGQTRELPRSFWIAVDYEGTEGWVNLRYTGRLGQTSDTTSDVVEELGETPSAGTMLELGMIVAAAFGFDPADVVVTSAPTSGDPGEVTLDLLGLADDSVTGSRVHVFGQASGSGFTLDTVELTLICARGVDGDGFCV